MTKTTVFRYGVTACILGSLTFCLCSKLGDSTDLGQGVINTVDPGKTDIDNYFHGFVLDSAYFQKSFSVPFPKDTGFGYHSVASSGNMFIGNANNEHSAGYVEVVLVRDSLASKRVFIGGDTLKSVKMVFSHDHVPAIVALQYDLYRVDAMNKPFDTVTTRKLGTMAFNAIDTNANIDTVELYDTVASSFGHLFCDSIFYACSTSTLDTLQRRDTLRFALFNKNADLDSVRGSCFMVLSAKRHSSGSDSSRVKTLSSSYASYVVAENGNLDSLSALPISSFASKRTAVYEYRVDSLWNAMDSIGAKSVLLTAGFLIPNKTADSLFVRCIVRPGIEHDGVLLDSVFNAESAILTVVPGSVAFASVVGALQKMFTDNVKPASVYLYIRYTNATSLWKTVSLDMKPSFKAMITNP